jgi:hypothetical protein
MNNEMWLAILGGGLGVAIITAIKELIIWALNRREGKKQVKIEDISQLKTDISILKEAQMVYMRDRVQHLCKAFISKCEISEDDLDNLNSMYSSYKRLGGNGHLDGLMQRVKRLNLK